MSRFDALDDVRVPDQWDDIVERAQADGLVDLEPDTSRRRARRIVPAVAIAASVLAVAIAVGVMLDDERESDVATTETSAPERPTDPATDDAPFAADDPPVLACTGAELLAGSIPADAVLGADAIWSFDSEIGPAVATWSWTVDRMDVQLVVPGIPWTDFVGERTEPLTGDLDGTLAYMWDPAFERETANAIVRTGMPEPCARAEVVVAGGAEVERVAVATEAARALRWRTYEGAPAAEDVVDESTMRAFALDAAAVHLDSNGAHPGVLEVTRYWSESGIGGRAIPGPAHDPQWVWTAVLWTSMAAGDGAFGGDVIVVNVGDSGEWNVAAGPAHGVLVEDGVGPGASAVPVLVVGTPTEDP